MNITVLGATHPKMTRYTASIARIYWTMPTSRRAESLALPQRNPLINHLLKRDSERGLLTAFKDVTCFLTLL